MQLVTVFYCCYLVWPKIELFHNVVERDRHKKKKKDLLVIASGLVKRFVGHFCLIMLPFNKS